MLQDYSLCYWRGKLNVELLLIYKYYIQYFNWKSYTSIISVQLTCNIKLVIKKIILQFKSEGKLEGKEDNLISEQKFKQFLMSRVSYLRFCLFIQWLKQVETRFYFLTFTLIFSHFIPVVFWDRYHCFLVQASMYSFFFLRC